MTRSRPIAHEKAYDPMLQDDDLRPREHFACPGILASWKAPYVSNTYAVPALVATIAIPSRLLRATIARVEFLFPRVDANHSLLPCVWCCVVCSCEGGWCRQRSGASRRDVCAHAHSISPSRHSFHSHACARRLTRTCTRRTRDRARTHAHTSAGRHT